MERFSVQMSHLEGRQNPSQRPGKLSDAVLFLIALLSAPKTAIKLGCIFVKVRVGFLCIRR